MRIWLFVLFIALSILGLGCSHKIGSDPIPADIVLNQKSASLVKASNVFTFNLLHKLPVDQDRNLLLSPLSISLAFSMALNGADGDTKSALIESLGFSGLTVEDINTIYSELILALTNADGSVVMKIANSIWIRKNYSVLTPFVSTNKHYYDAQVEALEFNQAALGTINAWVSTKTNGKITKILDQISPNEIMFLINAIYFNGKWDKQFDKAKTVNGSFTLSSTKSLNVPMMKINESFGYSEQLGYRALRMPYGRGKFQMTLLLPDEGTSVDQLLNQLTPSVWTNLNSTMTSTSKVDVWLPRFSFTWESDLNQIMSSLGMAVAFSPSMANFSKINSVDQLYITKVKHKTFIAVDEQGTTASGVTSIGIGVTSIGPQSPQFHAVRPFAFFISEKDTEAILFAGKVENPLSAN